MENIKFRHTTPIHISFNDFDASGHLMNSVYFSMYDEGKSTYFNETLPTPIMCTGINIATVSIDVNFLQPIYPFESIEMKSAVVEIGTKNLKLVQKVRNVDTDEVKCTFETIMTCYDGRTKCPNTIPTRWRENLAFYEGNSQLMKTQHPVLAVDE